VPVWPRLLLSVENACGLVDLAGVLSIPAEIRNGVASAEAVQSFAES